MISCWGGVFVCELWLCCVVVLFCYWVFVFIFFLFFFSFREWFDWFLVGGSYFFRSIGEGGRGGLLERRDNFKRECGGFCVRG